MKKLLTLNNLLFFGAVTFLVFTGLPAMINNFGKEGLKIESREHMVLDKSATHKQLMFPLNPRSIAIFWATWCAPCKLEMARFSKSVEEGEIPKDVIFAINPFESNDTVRSFLKKNSYPFTFIEDSGISTSLNVTKTPTTLFIENNEVISLSSGLSVFGIWRAESFL